jgi:ankyrin repeat protein
MSMSRALVEAAEKGDVDRLQQLLERGVDINSAQENGWTALMAAAAHGQTAAIELLLTRGADPNRTDSVGNTALHHAVCGNKDAILRALLDRGVDVNARTQTGYTALHLAVQDRRVRAVRRLIAAGANVNAQTTDQWALTPLKQALTDDKIRPLLEEAGARLDPRRETLVAQVVAQAAAARNRGESPHFAKKIVDAFVAAAAEGDLEVVRALLAAGMPTSVRHEKGHTALQVAVGAGRRDVFQVLLDAGADLDPATATQWPILVLAGTGGHVKIVQDLLERGLDPDQTGSDGITPLMAAALQDHAPVVQVLLEAGADPRRRGGIGVFARRPGKTALEFAQENRKKNVIPILAAAIGLTPDAADDPAYVAVRLFRETAETPAFQDILERLTRACGKPPIPWEKRKGVFRCYLPRPLPGQVEALQAEVRAADFQLIVYDSMPGAGGAAKLMVFPTSDKYAVVVARGTNGINHGLTTRMILAWLRILDRENPFDMIGCGFDFLEGQFRGPVVNADLWAQQMLEFCPDSESIANILSGLQRMNFFFWWD